MFLASNSLKRSDALQEESDLVVRRETSTAGIQFLRAICSFKPTEDMLDDTLMKLMQDVRSDGQEDVDVGELLPERMSYRLDACVATCPGECGRSVVSLPERSEDVGKVTQCAIRICVVSDVCRSDVALGTGGILAAGDEQLLGVVTNVHREDWVASPCNSITTDNFDAMDPSLDQWLEDCGQTRVEEVGGDSTACCFVRDMLEARGREIREEDLPPARWLAADVLREIAYRQVDRVSCLVAKKRKLGFIGGNNDRYNRRPRLSLLKLFLWA